MVLQLTKRRFTVDEYHRMAEAGILGEDDRVELIDGEIVEMAPIGRRHSGHVARLHEIFVRAFSDAAAIWGQNPIQLDEYTEPQPDLTLLRRRSDYYVSKIPTVEDVFLIVEVADTTTNLDRQVKMPLYARHGIPEFWLMDLNQQTITVYRDPTPDGYRTSWTVGRGAKLAPLAFPDRELAVADILG